MTKTLKLWRAKLQGKKVNRTLISTSFESCAIGERLGFTKVNQLGIPMYKNLTPKAYKLALDFCTMDPETKLQIIKKIESLKTILVPDHDPRLHDTFLVKK